MKIPQLNRQLKIQKGNFLVIMSFLATSFVLFFTIFSYIAKSYLTGTQDSETSAQLQYIVESVLERLPFEYNQNGTFQAGKTIINEEEPICKNFEFELLGANINQAIIDFGKGCEEGQTVEIGSGVESRVIKSATRMTEEETFYLDRYNIMEYRLDDRAFTEKQDGSEYQRPAMLKIFWWNDDTPPKENSKIEFILASWEEIGINKMSSNISVHRLVPSETQMLYDPVLEKNVFELYDFSGNTFDAPLFCSNACPSDYKNKEYFLFVKSFNEPLHVSIQGFDRSGEQLGIPSRYLRLEVTAIIGSEQNPLERYTKTITAKRQFYTDFDTSFPYAKYEIIPRFRTDPVRK